MSSDDVRRFQTEDITDLATAKLALRWALEKVRLLDEEIPRLNGRMVSKEEESSRLSKELARQSNDALNEKEIVQKTHELLEEYRSLMGASMEQLWKKYAPQEAETRKYLEDRVHALEIDLDQSRRRMEGAEQNARRAHDVMAKTDHERLELAETLRKREIELVDLREKVVSLEPEIQRLYNEKIRQIQEEFTARLSLLQEQMVAKEKHLQDRMTEQSLQLDRERSAAFAEAERVVEAKKAELERQREEW